MKACYSTKARAGGKSSKTAVSAPTAGVGPRMLPKAVEAPVTSRGGYRLFCNTNHSLLALLRAAASTFAGCRTRLRRRVWIAAREMELRDLQLSRLPCGFMRRLHEREVGRTLARRTLRRAALPAFAWFQANQMSGSSIWLSASCRSWRKRPATAACTSAVDLLKYLLICDRSS